MLVENDFSRYREEMLNPRDRNSTTLNNTKYHQDTDTSTECQKNIDPDV